MALLAVLGALFVLGFLAFAMIATFVGFFLRGLLWLVLLPFRLLWGVGAIVAVVLGAVAIVAGVVLATGLLPIALAVFLIWAVLRGVRRPALSN